ncbi:MAG TPA: DNA replication/repair protein RecF [Bacteroidia bacterium]|mgnify:CR=1 FL=1|nr:DNA replication/repair protein RecF [Bacteroidia bacterium]
MYLQKLVLLNFKNYQDANLDFIPTVNCFTGLNGSGKTNLLDAIHYLSVTKSYFSSSDTQNIKHGDHFLMIQGDFELNGIRESVSCGIKQGQKKQFKINQKEYERLSDHIGVFPVVMIAPTDQELITEGSEIRRKFMDGVISQYDHRYLEDLIRYNQIVSQRNAILKQAAAKGIIDWSSLSVWDDQLVSYGEKIFKKREEFISGFQPLFKKLFNFISGSVDDVSITYESQLTKGNFGELLQLSHSKDLDFQYTTTGIHKDDLIFNLKGYPARKYASQGQQKSLVIALKLAHFNYLCELGFAKPIVLLDDIFDKLDEQKVERLMELVSRDEFGQLFITDTHANRIPEIFSRIKIPLKLFQVENGIVTENEKALHT